MKKPDIGIIYPDYFSDDFGDIVTRDIQHEKLDLQIKQQEIQYWSSIEWAVPGIIAAYIFKPYFEGFLSEAGKDHYQFLKVCLSKLLKFTKDIPVTTLTSSKSQEKVDTSNSQSKAISIHIELKDGTKLKVMFDNGLTENDWLNSLDKILNSVRDHYETYPKDELSRSLKDLKSQPYNEIFAVINNESKRWDFLNMQQAIIKNIKSKK